MSDQGKGVNGNVMKVPNTTEEGAGDLSDDDGDVKKKKKATKVIRIGTKEDVLKRLKGPDGLIRLYEASQLVLFKGVGYEAEDVQNVMKLYKDWSFGLHPHMAFKDVLYKIDSVSSDVKVLSQLEALRETERDRYVKKKIEALGGETW
jgi:hypothetical protein